jgi:hypothetical protein
MQYKYKVMRGVVNNAIKLKKSVLIVETLRKTTNSPVIESLLKQYQEERMSTFISLLEDTINKGYAALNNPIRFKK